MKISFIFLAATLMSFMANANTFEMMECKISVSKNNKLLAEQKVDASLGGIVESGSGYTLYSETIKTGKLIKRNVKKEIQYGYTMNTWPNQESFSVVLGISIKGKMTDVGTMSIKAFDKEEVLNYEDYQFATVCRVYDAPSQF